MAKTSDHFDPTLLPISVLDPDWTVLGQDGPWSQSVANNGMVAITTRGNFVSSGTTANGTAQINSRNPASHMWSIGSSFQVIDWSKRCIAVIDFAVTSSTTNGICRLKWGENGNDAVGDQTVKGVGFKVAQLALSGQAHNGTTLDEPSLLTLTDDQTYRMVIDSDGKGTVKFYVDIGDGNGLVLKGTSTGGPTSASTAAQDAVIFETTNGGDTTDQRMYFTAVFLVKQT